MRKSEIRLIMGMIAVICSNTAAEGFGEVVWGLSAAMLFVSGILYAWDEHRQKREDEEAERVVDEWLENVVAPRRVFEAAQAEDDIIDAEIVEVESSPRAVAVERAFDPAVDNEAAYDARVAPLVDQITAICLELGMPFVACFQLTQRDLGPYLATTFRVSDNCAPSLKIAANLFASSVSPNEPPAPPAPTSSN